MVNRQLVYWSHGTGRWLWWLLVTAPLWSVGAFIAVRDGILPPRYRELYLLQFLPSARIYWYWYVIFALAYVIVVMFFVAPAANGRTLRRVKERHRESFRQYRERTTVNSALIPQGLQGDSAEPNIVLYLDDDPIDVHSGSEGIIEGHSVFDLRALIITCKNEREVQPSRKVGGVGNVSGEITFRGYGARPFILPKEFCVWLSEPGDRVNFPVGATQRLVVATFEGDNLCAVQRRSAQRGPRVSSTKLASDFGDLFRVQIALYADSERNALKQGDYMLERDGGALDNPQWAGKPLLVPTRLWREWKINNLMILGRALDVQLESEGESDVMQSRVTAWLAMVTAFKTRHLSTPIIGNPPTGQARKNAFNRGFGLGKAPTTLKGKINAAVHGLQQDSDGLWVKPRSS
jgi:hypothetical protein